MKYKVNKYTLDAVNHLVVDELTGKHFTVPCKGLLVVVGHSSYLFVEFFQLARDHSISPIGLSFYATHHLKPLDVGIFEPLANVYSLKQDK